MPINWTAYELKHLKNLNLFSAQVKAKYHYYIDTIFRAAQGMKVAEGEVFDITKKPVFINALNKLFEAMQKDMQAIIVNGVQQSWSEANGKNDEWLNLMLKGKLAPPNIPPEITTRFFDKNIPAMNQFIARKENGLNLSDRVWRYTDQFRTEIEAGLQLGITNGTPATVMATQQKQYLQDPDRLFRRVRNEQGELKLSKPAKKYHPGQGKYRSSYKNARRLAATETNAAYRASDHERWKTMNFVGGFTVKLSNRHIVPDICDFLKGDYPKDFKFVGWHPQCLCHAIPKLPSEKDFGAYIESIMAGEDQNFDFNNQVENVPTGLDNWMSENRERIKGWKNVPYFIRDNKKFIE